VFVHAHRRDYCHYKDKSPHHGSPLTQTTFGQS
jgi:hypothetical protein